MKDLTGQKFDLLTVIEFSHKEKRNNGNYRYYWRCGCECGNEVIRRSDGLKDKGIKSCGCYRKKYLSNIILKLIILENHME